MARMELVFSTPDEIAQAFASRIRRLRLDRSWKRSTLASRSGVTEASLKRFETTGKASLENLFKLCHALGRLDEFQEMLKPLPARSIAELEALEKAKDNRPKRGRV